MKKILILIAVVLTVFGGARALDGYDRLGNYVEQRAGVPKKMVVGTPVRLVIPAINIDTKIESVGKDSIGRMDIPQFWNNVAWYRLGYAPGQTGSAVISGHFDRTDGSPAVFYDLLKLKTGDKIIVYDDKKNEHAYTVIKSVRYPFDEVPLNEIFDTYGEKRLNLITCNGAYLNGNYTERLVVYSIQE